MRSTAGRLALSAAVLVAGAATAAPAQAAPYTCEASAVRLTLLERPIEPVVANRGKACETTRAGGAGVLPVPVRASILAAATELTGANGLQAGQVASASGGIGTLSIGSLPDLGLGPVLTQALAPAQAAVDRLPAALGLSLPLVGPVATVDVRGAAQSLLDELVKLPTGELLGLAAASSTVIGRCVDGTPRVEGASAAAGLRVLGQELPTDTATERSISILDTTNITASQIVDRALASFTTTLVTVDPATLRALLVSALERIPTIAIPGQVLLAKVTPAQQERVGGRLTQRALRVELVALARPLVDLVVGEAIVGSDGVDCAVPPPPPPPGPGPGPGPAPAATVEDLALACSTRRLVLTDVVAQDGRVRLLGAADKRLAGRKVDMVFEATGRRVASATVQRDGSFRTTAPLPSRRLRATNRARYQARLGKERSLNLKLFRRMLVYGVRVRDGKVTISGQVVRPLAAPVASIVLKRRVACGVEEVVRRFKPRRNGRFRVTVPAPAGVTATVYRLSTRVRRVTRSRTTSPTFTLPRGVSLVG